MEILLIINIEISIITISIDILIITTNPVKFRKPQKVARLQNGFALASNTKIKAVSKLHKKSNGYLSK